MATLCFLWHMLIAADCQQEMGSETHRSGTKKAGDILDLHKAEYHCKPWEGACVLYKPDFGKDFQLMLT